MFQISTSVAPILITALKSSSAATAPASNSHESGGENVTMLNTIAKPLTLLQQEAEVQGGHVGLDMRPRF